MRLGKSVLLVAVSLLVSITAKAVAPDGEGSPYRAIVNRNVFHLSSPTIPLATPEPKPIAPPKITLTGITTILGRKLAFLTIGASKPGQAAESFTLSEGQGVNGIEVKAIDEKAGAVTVINHGESQILDFDHDDTNASDVRYEPAPPIKISFR